MPLAPHVGLPRSKLSHWMVAPLQGWCCGAYLPRHRKPLRRVFDAASRHPTRLALRRTEITWCVRLLFPNGQSCEDMVWLRMNRLKTVRNLQDTGWKRREQFSRRRGARIAAGLGGWIPSRIRRRTDWSQLNREEHEISQLPIFLKREFRFNTF